MAQNIPNCRGSVKLVNPRSQSVIVRQPLGEKRCSAIGAETRSGRRCSRNVYLGQYCWQHGAKIDGVRVCRSQNGHGLSLIATKSFRRHDVIGTYDGEILTRTALDNRYTGNTIAEYGLCDDADETCVDGRNTNSSFVRFCNDANGTVHVNNARFVYLDHAVYGPAQLVAWRTINPGDEIFVNYGRDYWPRGPRGGRARARVKAPARARVRVKAPARARVRVKAPARARARARQ